MANFRYSHLFTTKIGNAALQAAAAKLNAAEIALAIADGEEKILFKNENGDVVAVATEEQILALLANKTDYRVDGTNGKALMFNETDGGGAKFEHNDGTWSFVGVNDGGENGIAGQIYALKKNTENKMEGSRIDISKGAMYYTVTSDGAAARMVPRNEIATKGNIEDAVGDVEALVEAEKNRAVSAETSLLNIITSEVAERKAAAVAGVEYNESGKTIDFYNANNVKIDSIDATAFIKDGMIDSVTLETTGGTTYLVITWNTAAGKEQTRIDIGDIFDADNYYTKTETDDLLDNKTDYQVNGTNGKALMFNEADGGGAKFEHNDGTWSFAGVNDGGKNGLAGQIYAVEPSNGYKGTKLDVTVGGLYYTKGEESGKPVAERDVEANEVATKGNVANAKVTAVDVDANAGITLTFADGSTLAATEAEEITLSAGEF